MTLTLTLEFFRGIFVVIVFAGLALWLIIHTIRNADDSGSMVVKWVISLPLIALILLSVRLFGAPGVFVIVLCAIVLSILWTPHLGGLFIKPLTSAFDGGDIPPEPRPAYSAAISKQKNGRYLEAVADIRQQLDRFPTDVEGHLLLGQIQAEDLKDLPGAELTIEHFVAQPGHAPKNIVFALYSLADWHLRFGHDREAARLAFQKIIELYPDSEFALGAAQRIAHLGGAEMDGVKKFNVVEGVRNLGLLRTKAVDLPAEQDPTRLADAYVKHLQSHPLDMEVREKLAVLYVENFQRLDLATGELEQMIMEPHQPAKSVIHWLNLLTDLQILAGASYETVGQTLQRIIDGYPTLAAAEMARNRLSILRLELKANQKTEPVKMGTYEQNLGLKKSS